MDMSSIINEMAVLFLVLAIGFAAFKFKILSHDSNKMLSKLIMNVAMPCTVLNSVISGNVTATGSQAAVFILLAAASLLIMLVLSYPVARLMTKDRTDKGMLMFLMTFGNVAFMGYPVIETIFGSSAVFYVTLLNIPFNILLFTVGIMLVSTKGGKFDYKLLVTPTLIMSILSIFIFAFHIQLPKIIVDASGLVGHMTTPGAMLVIGSTLAALPLKKVFNDWRIYPSILIKLFILPVLTWLIFHFFVKDPFMLGILVVEAGMPTATAAAMFALNYDGNDELASKGVFVMTLLSVATIPLMAFFLNAIA